MNTVETCMHNIYVHLLQEYMEIIPYFQLKLRSSVYYLQVMRLSY